MSDLKRYVEQGQGQASSSCSKVGAVINDAGTVIETAIFSQVGYIQQLLIKHYSIWPPTWIIDIQWAQSISFVYIK
jgi:hypothetical protein